MHRFRGSQLDAGTGGIGKNLVADHRLALVGKNLHRAVVDQDVEFHLAVCAPEGGDLDVAEYLVSGEGSGAGAVEADLLSFRIHDNAGLLGGALPNLKGETSQMVCSCFDPDPVRFQVELLHLARHLRGSFILQGNHLPGDVVKSGNRSLHQLNSSVNGLESDLAGSRHDAPPGIGRYVSGIAPVVHPCQPDPAVTRHIGKRLRGIEVLSEIDLPEVGRLHRLLGLDDMVDIDMPPSCGDGVHDGDAGLLPHERGHIPAFPLEELIIPSCGGGHHLVIHQQFDIGSGRMVSPADQETEVVFLDEKRGG